jgi:hypothetical protein
MLSALRQAKIFSHFRPHTYRLIPIATMADVSRVDSVVRVDSVAVGERIVYEGDGIAETVNLGTTCQYSHEQDGESHR